ncbi:hypothetical protein RM572_26925 [Streptomyces sp. DSM 42041]|uniref:Uncharacterized protein n=1 Tax=Streptomyces hazeniae TaxID=3075538 RepID=A0ABU2P3B9_9ACTN|nr:hypothetical protein [Streptomyces sp. DSM 42041]MDT0382398.1 hypothetical protein [Streptomyces sp. DSM 42041]
MTAAEPEQAEPVDDRPQVAHLLAVSPLLWLLLARRPTVAE